MHLSFAVAKTLKDSNEIDPGALGDDDGFTLC
jgi:hypothetical protein